MAMVCVGGRSSCVKSVFGKLCEVESIGKLESGYGKYRINYNCETTGYLILKINYYTKNLIVTSKNCGQ